MGEMEGHVDQEVVVATVDQVENREVVVHQLIVPAGLQCAASGDTVRNQAKQMPASAGAAETVPTGHLSAASGATVKKVALVEEMDVVEAAAGGRGWLSCMASRTKNSIIQSKVGKMQG